jgi:Fe-S-cluster containining protein
MTMKLKSMKEGYEFEDDIGFKACGKCHNCCRQFFTSYRPKIFSEEINRIALVKNLKVEDFTQDYKGEKIIRFDENYWCPFIDKHHKTGKCTIWDIKPIECSLYPIFCFTEEGRKVIAIDLNCPLTKAGEFEVDVADILKHNRYFEQIRHCKKFSKAILLKC